MTVTLALIRILTLELPRKGTDDFDIFSCIFDLVILYLASLCGIDMDLNEETIKELLE